MTPYQLAKQLGATHYVSGKPCSRGHFAKRLTSTGACLVCVRLDRTMAPTDIEEMHRWKETNG